VRNSHKSLVRKPEGMRPLGSPRSRWKDNIKMDLKETGCEGVDWIQLSETSGFIKCVEFID
jgi:hypothetical protein